MWCSECRCTRVYLASQKNCEQQIYSNGSLAQPRHQVSHTHAWHVPSIPTFGGLLPGGICILLAHPILGADCRMAWASSGTKLACSTARHKRLLATSQAIIHLVQSDWPLLLGPRLSTHSNQTLSARGRCIRRDINITCLTLKLHGQRSQKRILAFINTQHQCV